MHRIIGLLAGHCFIALLARHVFGSLLVQVMHRVEGLVPHGHRIMGLLIRFTCIMIGLFAWHVVTGLFAVLQGVHDFFASLFAFVAGLLAFVAGLLAFVAGLFAFVAGLLVLFIRLFDPFIHLLNLFILLIVLFTGLLVLFTGLFIQGILFRLFATQRSGQLIIARDKARLLCHDQAQTAMTLKSKRELRDVLQRNVARIDVVFAQD